MKSILKVLMVIPVLLSSINSFSGIKATNEVTQITSQLTAVSGSYFSIKDALISSNASTAATKAKNMATAIKAVDMGKLSTEEHNAWMKVMQDLTRSAEAISKSKDIQQQREAFNLLSKNMYELAKESKQPVPVYYQHCPMANNGKGANWLSKEPAIKNPYYGNKMLTCGSVTETIK
ncbi:DUF3347 domain-containing protein [Sphingobacterium sp. JB170]|uniref:DUF3347 domain-containing protein n=1 Tax=Sphingobacterium sp. JB170 TaxID=1434842 RepID=UPI00211B6C04|nr:DUF3347 domain-containing protein [Sphingobacterium sp. JB170]